MKDIEITNLILLKLFRQCSHLQRRIWSFQGQGLILTLLSERGTITQRELADIAKRRSATVSEQLELMEKKGFIIREQDKTDKRNIIIYLTEEGRQAAREAEKESAEIAEMMFSVLDENEKRQFYSMLQKLKAVFEENDRFGH